MIATNSVQIVADLGFNWRSIESCPSPSCDAWTRNSCQELKMRPVQIANYFTSHIWPTFLCNGVGSLRHIVMEERFV